MAMGRITTLGDENSGSRSPSGVTKMPGTPKSLSVHRLTCSRTMTIVFDRSAYDDASRARARPHFCDLVGKREQTARWSAHPTCLHGNTRNGRYTSIFLEN